MYSMEGEEYMEKGKKVIILDLDETLEHGIYQSRYDVGNQMTMILRPNLDMLLNKLYEVKNKILILYYVQQQEIFG